MTRVNVRATRRTLARIPGLRRGARLRRRRGA